MSQFTAMAGLYGCLPNYVEECDSFQEAVDTLSDLHELGQRRRAALKASGFISLSLHRDGNEYAEIVKGEPECHST